MTTTQTHTVAHFEIQHTQFIDALGHATQPLPECVTQQTLVDFYQAMLTLRCFDEKAIKLQRTGNMGTYPSCRGAEAINVGIAAALDDSDVFCPYYRDQGILMQRSGDFSGVLQYWGGDERGSLNQHQQDLPICVPIASQCLHAAGIAFSMQYRKQARAALCTLGEGGTSEGDFYEAMNVAGTWNLPLVFVVNNNQWAISVPLSEQTRCQTIAQKAIAAGIPGVQIDGNDVVAVHHAVTAALHQARQGNGPTLIEAVSYRLSDHTTADDATRYQQNAQRQTAEQQEPLIRLQRYLTDQQYLTQTDIDRLQQQANQTVKQAVADYSASSPVSPTSAFDYLYASLPDAYIEQYDDIGAQS